MVTQWSVTWFVSDITQSDTGGILSRIKDISLKQFALLPLTPVPLVSQKENIFPALAIKTLRQVPVVSVDHLVPSLALTLFPSWTYDGNTCFDT